MFSRPGKDSTSKYHILAEKDSIIKRQFKFKKPERPKFDITTLPIDEINSIAIKEQSKLEKVFSPLGKS